MTKTKTPAADKPKPRLMLRLPGVPDIEITYRRVLDSLPEWMKVPGND